jgi:hypothetical protein
VDSIGAAHGREFQRSGGFSQKLQGRSPKGEIIPFHTAVSPSAGMRNRSGGVVKAPVIHARQGSRQTFHSRKKKLSSLLVMASFLPRNWLQAKTVTPSGIFLQ